MINYFLRISLMRFVLIMLVVNGKKKQTKNVKHEIVRNILHENRRDMHLLNENTNFLMCVIIV